MQLPAPPPKKRFKPKVIKECDFDSGSASWSWLAGTSVENPPEQIRNDFDWTCKSWACFDIETHDLAPGRTKSGWEIGDFGHQRLKTDYKKVRDLRAVQIGLTVGSIDSGEPPKTMTYLVKPNGFTVTDAVSKIHKITHTQAMEMGLDLRFVLSEFLRELFLIVDKGGRICAHQIEFDAAIISAELARAGFEHEICERWGDLVTCGLCTMNPLMTGWCCKRFCEGINSYGNGTLNRLTPCALPAVAWTLLAPHDDLLQAYHNAGTDSRLCWWIVREYHLRIWQTNKTRVNKA